ncbi:MAG: c-type cytochrome [Bacteroidota bacterium]|nr:cytochrome c family protein [Kiloniellaceae bacterium]
MTFSVILLLSASLTAAAPAGDPERGAEIYERCQACHALERNRTGPKHCDLLGRPAGTAPGFRGYSAALKGSGIVWDRDSLDRFLADPLGSVPGTRMGYAGVKDPQERADLIAFLAAAEACKE